MYVYCMKQQQMPSFPTHNFSIPPPKQHLVDIQGSLVEIIDTQNRTGNTILGNPLLLLFQSERHKVFPKTFYTIMSSAIYFFWEECRGRLFKLDIFLMSCFASH